MSRYALVSLLLLVGVDGVRADDWSGDLIMMKTDGVQSGRPAVGGGLVLDGPIQDANYAVRVLKDDGTRLHLLSGDKNTWIFKDNAIHIKDAPGYFTEQIELRPTEGKNYGRRAVAWLHSRKDQVHFDPDGRLTGETENALRDLTEAIRLAPREPRWWGERGWARLYANEHDLAIRDFDELIRLRPASGDGYVRRGAAYAMKGDLKRAVLDYTKAIEIGPCSAAYCNRAGIWVRTSDYVKALSDYTKSIELSPNQPGHFCSRGSVYERLKRYQEAARDYQTAIELDPRDDLGYYKYASLLAGCPDPKVRNGARAIEIAKKAVSLDSTAWWNLAALAAAYAEAGDFNQAVVTQEEVIAMLKSEKDPVQNVIHMAEAALGLYRTQQPYRYGG